MFRWRVESEPQKWGQVPCIEARSDVPQTQTFNYRPRTHTANPSIKSKHCSLSCFASTCVNVKYSQTRTAFTFIWANYQNDEKRASWELWLELRLLCCSNRSTCFFIDKANLLLDTILNWQNIHTLNSFASFGAVKNCQLPGLIGPCQSSDIAAHFLTFCCKALLLRQTSIQYSNKTSCVFEYWADPEMQDDMTVSTRSISENWC